MRRGTAFDPWDPSKYKSPDDETLTNVTNGLISGLGLKIKSLVNPPTSMHLSSCLLFRGTDCRVDVIIGPGNRVEEWRARLRSDRVIMNGANGSHVVLTHVADIRS
jgi:hypothetical protein